MSNTDLSRKLVELKPYSENDSIQSYSHCSCSQCDPNFCFELRNHKGSFCTCSACRQANINDSAKSIKEPDVTLQYKEPNDSVRVKESNKSIPVKEPTDPILGKESNKFISINEPNNPKSAKESSRSTVDTDPIVKNKESVIKSKMLQIQKEIFPEMKDHDFSEVDDSKYTKYRCKDVTLKKQKVVWNEKDQAYQKTSTKKFVHSVAITYSPKERENSTVKLSAQIMDMPYEEVKDSLVTEDTHKSEIKEEKPPSLNIIDLVKPDILSRLKEIYKACSCKVCDCITDKLVPLNYNSCGCSPCNCEECIKFETNLQKHNKKVPPHSGFPCVICDRKDCRGVVKKTGNKNCDCKPCDCTKCVEEKFIQSCSCIPCQCTQCVALGLSRPKTLPPVQGIFQQNTCQYDEPCGSDNCTYKSALTSNLRRETSTDVTCANCSCERCSNNSCQINKEVCRCDTQNKVMKKSYDSTNTDKNIHRTGISYKDRKNRLNNQDTIAMFALSKNYINAVGNINNSNCLECECSVCKKAQRTVDESQERSTKAISEKYSQLSTNLSRICKYSPCDCHVCNKNYKRIDLKCIDNYCGCNKCDCLICKVFIQKTNKYKDTTKIHNTMLQVETLPKRGRIFTASMFDVKIRSVSELQSRIDDKYKNIRANKSLSTKLSHHKEVRICHKESRHINIPVKANVFEETTKKSPDFFKYKRGQAYTDLNDNNKNMSGNKVFNFKRNVVSKKTDDSLILNEIFKSNIRNPIRDMNVLSKCIFLAKSNSKIDLESDINNSMNTLQTTDFIFNAINDEISLQNEKDVTKQPVKCKARYNLNRIRKPYIKNYNRKYRKCMIHSEEKINTPLNKTDEDINKIDANRRVLLIIENIMVNLPLYDSTEKVFTNIENVSELSIKKAFETIQTENTFAHETDKDQISDFVQNDIKSWPKTRASDKDISNMSAMELGAKEICKRKKTTEVTNIDKKQNGKQALNYMNQKCKSIYSDAFSQTLKIQINVDKETNCNFLQPLESLNKNMEQLVEYILARAAYKSNLTETKYDLTHNMTERIPKIHSTKSSCDGLKAAFIGLKTISDHTLMVKWRLPRQLDDVLGYELQVDGRPVPKIFSPTKRMAILTCLPHTDKILLTIRKLTTNLPSDHSPAATVVYRPRVK